MMATRMNICYQLCFVATIGLVSAGLTGCGVDRSSLGGATTPMATLSGFAHGGPQPVVGATVSLYATTSGGYGATATLLGTAVTGAIGQFTFVSPLPCPTGQQAYVTATGGDPGAGPNANYLVMAALGPCSTISPSTTIWIDEVTTVAAAYALRPFTSITSVAGLPVVNVGAPANNNVSTGTCSTVSNVTTACAAAGLGHAFANALNLANSVSIGGTMPTGTAYSVAPSNPDGVVPQALINSLANSIEACVNSRGGSTGDGSPCGTLFAATTPPVTSPAAPINTLQALLNVAQYPALTPTQVTNLFNVASGFTNYYLPTLSSAPADFSLAISYSGVTPSAASGTITSLAVTNINASGFGSGLGYTAVPAVSVAAPTSGTTATAAASLGLVYFTVTGGTCTNGTQNVTISGGGGTGATATATIAGGTATGGTVTASGSGYTSLPTFVVQNCTVQPAAASKVKALGVVGLVVTNTGSGYTAAPSVTVAAPTGSAPPTPVTATATADLGEVPFNAPYSLALDANDDVFIGSQNLTGTAGLYSYLSGMSANGASLFSTSQSTTYLAPRGSATDTLGNIWIAQNNTTAIQGFTTSGAAASPAVLTTGAAPFGIGVDQSNNIWYGIASTSAQNLFELQQSTAYTNVTFTPNMPQFTNAVRTIAFNPSQNVFVSGFNATTNTAGVFPNTNTAAAPSYGANPVINATLSGASGAGLALDANSNAWAPTTAGIFEVVPTFGGGSGITATALSPTTSLADNAVAPNYDSVDGSGSIWIPNNGTGAQNITQFLTGTSVANTLSPCYAPNGAQTCAATSLSQPQRTQVDSTGSVWITSLSNGRVYQLIGTGSPTWPQMSFSNPGVMPQ